MADNLPEPASRKEQYLATIAGMTGIDLPKPASRIEEYLAAIAENGGGGGGGSYTAGDGITIEDDTISVDTTTIQEKLTAGDNITIADDTISATDTTYSNFVGTDGQTAGTAGLVPAPATTDAGKYLKADGTWDTVQTGGNYTAGDGIDISVQDVISATNTGKARVLTTDDYNWPTSNPNKIALWLLDEGTYIVPYGGALSIDYGVGIGIHSEVGAMFLVAPTNRIAGTKKVFAISGISNYYSPYLLSYTSMATGSGIFRSIPAIVDNLISTSTTSALSANQGKVLNDKFGGMQLVKISQTDYDNLVTKDPNTLYVITGA